MILCGKMCLYFLFLESLHRFILTAQNWHAKCFVLKEGIVVLKYQLLKTEKYAWNTLSAVRHLPEHSISLWKYLLSTSFYLCGKYSSMLVPILW